MKTSLKKKDPLCISSFRYIHDVLSLNVSQFGDYLLNEFEVSTDYQMFAFYLELQIDNELRLKTKLYDKHDFTFPIVNFPFISCNINSTVIF
jgi:hypothetical protein